MEYKTERATTPLFGELEGGELFRFTDNKHVNIKGPGDRFINIGDGYVGSAGATCPVVRVKPRDGVPVFVDA